MDPIVQAYSAPQQGGDLPYFIGGQSGGGWLRSIARVAFPILKRLGGMALKTASKTAEDVIMRDEKILPALKANAMGELGNLLTGSNTTFTPRSGAPKNRKGKKKKKKSLRGGGVTTINKSKHSKIGNLSGTIFEVGKKE